MMARRPTVYDVAERAGVSIATVSFAFRQPERVRPETRASVLAAAQEIGYVPSGSARSLARGRTGALGLYSFDLLLERPQAGRGPAADRQPGPCPSGDEVRPAADGALEIAWDDAHDEVTSDPRAFPLYVDEVQRGFELECAVQGRALLLSSGEGSPASVSETAGRVDGLAVFPGAASLGVLDGVAQQMPVVLFSRPPSDDGFHRVVVDNRAGMRDLVAHLIVDHGLRDLEFVGALSVSDYADRFAAFGAALAEHGLAPTPTVLDASAADSPDALAALADAVDAGRLPQALVCASDQIALVVLDLLAGRGVRVPQDVVVTGFDGVLAGQLASPSLTTVRQPMEAMGRLAARLLVEQVDAPGGAPRTYRLGVRLVRRASCGCGRPAAR